MRTNIEKVVDYCTEKDVIVVFGADESEYDYEDDVIYLADYEDENEILFSLLHECGHFVIQERDNYTSEYADKHRFTSKEQYIRGFMKEEYDAWKEGRYLAQKLGIALDEIAYEELSSKCLELYRKAFK